MFVSDRLAIRLHLDQQKLLHFLHLRCLLPRPLPLLGVDLGPPQPVLVIHRKTIMDNIEYSAGAPLAEVVQLYTY